MAYELHLRRDPPIGREEWDAVAGPQLATFTRWDGGEIVARPREEDDVALLVAAAGRLKARVEGDDGEAYPGPAARRPWIARWRKLVDRVLTPLRPMPPCAYRVGDRVHDAIGRREGEVVALRPIGNGVRVVVRYPGGVEIATLVFGAAEEPMLRVVRRR